MEIMDTLPITKTFAVDIEPICKNLNLLESEISGMTAVIFDDCVIYTDEPWDYILWGFSRFDHMVKDIPETIYFA